MSSILTEQSASAARIRNLMRKMVESKVFKFGDFVLKSGQHSPIYIDLRECFGYPDLMECASRCVAEMISRQVEPFSGIVGVPYAALPYATLASSYVQKPLIIIRKEAKAYGTKKLIEGLYAKGETVVIIEDVVTSGGSIKDVVRILREEGLVVEDVYCLLDREQGGKKALEEEGIRLHSLLNMERVLSFLISTATIDEATWQQIVTALNLGYTSVEKFDIGKGMEDEKAYAADVSPRVSLDARLSHSTNPLNKKLLALMQRKKSNVCLAVDYTEADKVLELAEKAGPFVCAIKIHADAVVDWSREVADRLVRLANDHEFLIFEDRKFADTGNTVSLQLAGSQQISDWADVVTCHAVQGADSIGAVFRKEISDPSKRLSGVLLIAELSCKGSLTTAVDGYKQMAASIAASCPDVVCGFICQTKVTEQPEFMHWTPGVNLDATSDSAGQQWRTIEKAIQQQQNDIVIVGRGVTGKPSPVQELKRYREAAWAALTAPAKNGTA